LRVAVVAPSVFPCPNPGGYGFEMFLWDLCNELSRREGVELTLIAPKGSKTPEGGALLETIDAPGRFDDEEERAYNAYKARLGEFDIVHDFSHNKFSYLAKLENPRLKVLGTVQGIQTWRSPPPVAKPNITCLSIAHSRDMLHRYGLKTRVIPNAVDLKRYKFKAEKGDRLLCLSLMAPQKGHFYAVFLAKKLGVALDVAGEDEFIPSPAYVEYVKSICEGSVKYLGKVSDVEKLRLLQDARAVILPFLSYEVDSIIAKEAMSCGTPVVAFNTGAMAEIVRHGRSGYVAGGLEGEHGMLGLLREIDRIRPSECRGWVEEKFSIEKVADAYLEAYRDVYKGREW
jgi:glycosyltransferase involved in cell wall biosynthesis